MRILNQPENYYDDDGEWCGVVDEHCGWRSDDERCILSASVGHHTTATRVDLWVSNARRRVHRKCCFHSPILFLFFLHASNNGHRANDGSNISTARLFSWIFVECCARSLVSFDFRPFISEFCWKLFQRQGVCPHRHAPCYPHTIHTIHLARTHHIFTVSTQFIFAPQTHTHTHTLPCERNREEEKKVRLIDFFNHGMRCTSPFDIPALSFQLFATAANQQ